MNTFTFRCVSAAAAALTVIATAIAVEPDRDKDQQALEEITITGSRVTAGGAKDINFARAEIEHGRIPHPDSLTVEGLLSEHDLLLPAKESCRQLFCLTGEAMTADLPTLPTARYLIGLGFSSNIDSNGWKRAPLNVVAVVDKSGSMDGPPLALVRRSLRNLVGEMVEGDQLSIVLYGDRSHVYLQPTRVTATGRRALLAAIDRIESAGSTNMEDGLKLGYEVARQTRAHREGVTRVVLFTDERPNVGETDADSFAGMARAASLEGIGLTTIGVGVQFDTKLATALSSTRGGNLFFLDSEKAADTIFAKELDYMVSELAHDVEINLRPNANYRIAGVYGVPGELLGWQDETSVTVRIPTVFLSQRGGGIFVSLASPQDLRDLPPRSLPQGESLMTVSMSYVPLRSPVAEAATLAVANTRGAPSAPMKLGGVLVDQFLSLRAATTAHYVQNDQESAYRILQGLRSRFDALTDRSLIREVAPERELVATLFDRMAFLSGHTSEGGKFQGSALWGNWQVADVHGDHDFADLGDVVVFSVNNELAVYTPGAGGDRNYRERFAADYLATKREVLLPDNDVVLHYSAAPGRLTLRIKGNGISESSTIQLKKFTGALPGH